jgi:2,4-dienoyl-CoA reductase-like NADH-dependent reductase (Old Yellow Enzyme family)/thioredoxin reductase
MSKKHFPHLFTEGQIGNFKTRNRIVMLPMARQFQGLNGEVTQKTIDYFAERAKGGVGLIIIGSTRVFPPGHQFFTPASLNLSDNRYLPGHCDLVQAIHACGCKIAIQFGHIGGQISAPNVAASNVQQFFCDGTPYHKPRPVTRGEIYDIIDLFGAGALMARTAGYDMAEIHAAHDYLFGGFLSPKLNLRTDEFGGLLENRTRILVEIIRQMKRMAGRDFPVSVRISADDYLEDSIDLDESPKTARILEEAGADVINVSAGCHETQHLSNDIMRLEEGFKRPLFEAIKKTVNIPIIVGGGYRNPGKGEEIVADGVADFLGMARTLLADPQWPIKAEEGRIEDIRRCISCGECLYQMGGKFAYPQGCTVNAVFSREREWSEVKPAEVKKKVMIIGAGPGGMEAARIAAMRGHEVGLYDKEKQLGGQLLVAAKPPGKDRLLWIRDYEESQLKKLGVNVRLGIEVTAESVKREKPDVVILATGAEPAIPDIDGIDRGNVVTAVDILTGKVEPKNQRVAIAGGGLVGTEVGEFLLERGNEVTIVEMLPVIASDMEPTNRRGLLDALQIYGDKVKLLPDHKVAGITTDGLKVFRGETGEETTIQADTIVLALGSKPVHKLADALKERGIPFYSIGDCQNPKNIRQAIYEGALIGRQL